MNECNLFSSDIRLPIERDTQAYRMRLLHTTTCARFRISVLEAVFSELVPYIKRNSQAVMPALNISSSSLEQRWAMKHIQKKTSAPTSRYHTDPHSISPARRAGGASATLRTGTHIHQHHPHHHKDEIKGHGQRKWKRRRETHASTKSSAILFSAMTLPDSVSQLTW
jgi:hypothetical protein